MQRRTKWLWAGASVAALAVAGAGYRSFSGSEAARAAPGASFPARPGKPFSYDDYAAALKAYVDDRGLVDYRGLKADPDGLHAFAAAVVALDPAVYETWDEKAKIAFWLNAYNALTLEGILANYPIRASFGRSLLYPKNSIRQIAGVWDRLTWTVMGRTMTLDEIEHETLRKEFDEPRIHIALVCASIGCPPLRAEPYVGEKLDAQLADQTRRFLRDPRKFLIDRQRQHVYLSPIFRWFGDDFLKVYSTRDPFQGHSESVRAALHFICQHIDETDRHYLERTSLRVKYLDHDWSLNEQDS